MAGPRRNVLWYSTAGVAVLVCLVAALYWLPIVLTRQPAPSTAEGVLAAQSAARTGCVAALVAIFTAGTVIIGWRSFTLGRLGQFADRYGSAVAQLGDQSIDVRIGGVCALRALARDSRVDRRAVIDVLSAYVRKYRRPAPFEADLFSSRSETPQLERIQPDLAAALAVLAQSTLHPADGYRIDLRESDLRGAELHRGDLSRARMYKANLSGARITQSDLRGVSADLANLRSTAFDESLFMDSHLDRAQLAGARCIRAVFDRMTARDADFSTAMLFEASMVSCDLSGSDLTGARLADADLRDSNLERVDLTGADLTNARLDGVRFDGAILVGAIFTKSRVAPNQLAGASDVASIQWVD